MSYICLSVNSPGFARYAIVSSVNNDGFDSFSSRNPTSYFYFLLNPVGYDIDPWALDGMAITKQFSSSFGKDGCEMEGGKKRHGVAEKPSRGVRA